MSPKFGSVAIFKNMTRYNLGTRNYFTICNKLEPWSAPVKFNLSGISNIRLRYIIVLEGGLTVFVLYEFAVSVLGVLSVPPRTIA